MIKSLQSMTHDNHFKLIYFLEIKFMIAKTDNKKEKKKTILH